MFWYVCEPSNAGGFEADVWIDATGHGTVDNGLLLLVQQRDQLFLRPDVALDATVRMIEETDDGRLLREGWKREPDGLDRGMR
jgi:hypothetical protein